MCVRAGDIHEEKTLYSQCIKVVCILLFLSDVLAAGSALGMGACGRLLHADAGGQGPRAHGQRQRVQERTRVAVAGRHDGSFVVLAVVGVHVVDVSCRRHPWPPAAMGRRDSRHGLLPPCVLLMNYCRRSPSPLAGPLSPARYGASSVWSVVTENRTARLVGPARTVSTLMIKQRVESEAAATPMSQMAATEVVCSVSLADATTDSKRD